MHSNGASIREPKHTDEQETIVPAQPFKDFGTKRVVSNGSVQASGPSDGNVPGARLIDPKRKTKVQLMDCAACAGRGHVSCPRCDFYRPDPECVPCDGWGFVLCLLCSGGGKLTPTAASPFSFPNHIHDMAALDGVSAAPFSRLPNPRLRSRVPDRLFRQKRIGKTYAEDYWNDLQRTRNSNEQRGAPGQPLSALHREKIRASLKGYSKGVPKSEEHRRKISRALQRSMTKPEHREKIAAAHRGKQKRCRLCGTYGHNIKTCPQNGILKPVKEMLQVRGSKRTPRRCKVCGQLGHDRRNCPVLDKHATNVSDEN